jgi:rubrerythrin
MKFENLEAIINFAIEKEKEAADFYETTSKEVSFSGVKEMFLEFANEERKHQRLLEGFGKECSLKKDDCVGKDIAGYKLKWITDLKRSDFTVDIEYKKGMAYNEVLMLAMKREEKALKQKAFSDSVSGRSQT